MKFIASAVTLLAFAGAASAAPTKRDELPETHCLNTILQVNTKAIPKSYNFSTLVSLGKNLGWIVNTLAGMNPAVPNVTVFAPTDEAFATFVKSVGGSLPTQLEPLVPEIISYHLSHEYADVYALPPVSGIETALGKGNLSHVDPQLLVANNSPTEGVILSYGLGNAGVIDTLKCSNGIIHVVNSVLYPPNPASATLGYANLLGAQSALIKAGLADDLDAMDNVTFFAPTDAAFAELAETFANYTKSKLGYAIMRHAVPGRVMSFDLKESQNVTNVHNASVAIKVVNGTVFVGDNGAKVIRSNILTTNGVVHIIDKVLTARAATH